MRKRELVMIMAAITFGSMFLLAGLSLYIVNDMFENPIYAGERFGPLVHVVARSFPIPLSEQESPAFQGLTNPRSQPTMIQIYDITDLSEEEQIQAKVVQGLMNRDKPTLYLIEHENEDQFWLSQIDAETEVVSKLDYSVYQTIKYDPDNVKQKYLAITLAGVHDAMPSTSEGSLYDLTNLSRTDLHNMMLETSEHTNKKMISFRSGKIDHIDFIVKNKIFLSPLALQSTTILPVDHKSSSESELIREIMSQMDPDCAMVGYNINAGIAGEVETMNFLSEFGCYSIPVPNVPNLSFFSGLPREQPSHSTIESDVQLDDKVYVVILMSDGDNLELPYKRYDSFEQEHENPLTWSITPFLNEFAPPIFNYYSSNLPESDAFVVAPSGGGFGYPSRNINLLAFVEHTDRLMNELDLQYIWLLDHPYRGYSPELLAKFADISNGLFMEYTILRNYEDAIEFYKDTPAVWSAAFVEKDGDIAQRIIQRTPQERPAFLVIGIEMRYNSPQHIDSEIARLDPDLYEVVSAQDFFRLVSQASLPESNNAISK
jgi:hypothetical protein